MNSSNESHDDVSTVEVVGQGLREAADFVRGCLRDIEQDGRRDEALRTFRSKALRAIRLIGEAHSMLLQDGNIEE